MNESQFFAKTSKPAQILTGVFAPDTRHPGVIHARVLYLLEHGCVREARDLIRDRLEVVQDSTIELFRTHRVSLDD